VSINILKKKNNLNYLELMVELKFNKRKHSKKLRADRDSKKLEKALSAMQSAADTEENLMPYIVTAAKAFATTGEISNTFREVFGEYRPKEVF
jgi:methylmalonyl-CoA mutase N-terminal domain/subunit